MFDERLGRGLLRPVLADRQGKQLVRLSENAVDLVTVGGRAVMRLGGNAVDWMAVDGRGPRLDATDWQVTARR
jgi:hypothetical protein